MTITIRPLEPKDFEACEKICQQARSHFSIHRPCLVAVHSSGRLLGCCTYRDHCPGRPWKWELCQISVEASVRRQGVGRQLLQSLIERIPPGVQLEAFALITEPDFRLFLARSRVPWTSCHGGDCGMQKWTWKNPAAPETPSPEGIANVGSETHDA